MYTVRLVITAILASAFYSAAVAQKSRMLLDSTINARISEVNIAHANQTKRLDSLSRAINSVKFQRMEHGQAVADSAHMKIAAARHRLDSLTAAANANLTRLTTLNLSKKKKKLELSKFDQLQRPHLTKANTKIDALTKQVGQSQERLLSKLSPMDSFGVKIEHFPTPQNKLNLNFTGIQDRTIPGNDELKIGPSPQLETGGINISLSVPTLTEGIPNTELNSPTLDPMARVKTDLPSTTVPGNLSGEIAKVKDANPEAVSKAIEEKVSDDVVTKELTMEERKVIALKEEHEKNLKLIEQYKDKDLIRKQLTEKAMNLANEQLGQYTTQVTGGMKSLGKYKRRYADIQSIKNLPKRPPNPMKGKPMRERLEPGIWLQVEQRKEFNLFISPLIGYRITGRLTAGLGVTFRLQGSVIDSLRLYTNQPVIGPRVFTNISLIKGLYSRLEFESLSVSSKLESEPNNWVNSINAGVGKKFTISRRWNGDVQGAYNFIYDEETSPNASRYSLRFGFIVNLEKGKR